MQRTAKITATVKDYLSLYSDGYFPELFQNHYFIWYLDQSYEVNRASNTISEETDMEQVSPKVTAYPWVGVGGLDSHCDTHPTAPDWGAGRIEIQVAKSLAQNWRMVSSVLCITVTQCLEQYLANEWMSGKTKGQCDSYALAVQKGAFKKLYEIDFTSVYQSF